MKRLQYHQYGGPEVMKLEHFVLATPDKDEVTVRVKVAAINPVDWKIRNGDMKMITGKNFPRGLGIDFSGEVISVGSNVTRFKPGDHVFGMSSLKASGAIAEAVITKEALLALKPESISFEEAACLATPGTTAWNGLVDKAKITNAKKVFINGCTGAVGQAAVQIATAFGALVSGSCSEEGMQRARELGVANAYNYRTTDFTELNGKFDIAYDTAASMKTSSGLALVRQTGIFLDINPTPIKFLKALFNRRLKPIICTPKADILEKLAHMASTGTLQFQIGKIVTLDEAIGLLTELELGKGFIGKGLVKMD